MSIMNIFFIVLSSILGFCAIVGVALFCLLAVLMQSADNAERAGQ